MFLPKRIIGAFTLISRLKAHIGVYKGEHGDQIPPLALLFFLFLLGIFSVHYAL